MNVMDIFMVAVVFVIIIGIAAAVFIIACWDKKKQEEHRRRCTVLTNGIVLRVNQAVSANSEDAYNYYPVVQYVYLDRTYEMEYQAASRLWSRVKANTAIDVFVNPQDAEDIYISIPDEVREKNRKEKKYIILFLIVWCIIAVVGMIFFKK